MVMRYFGGGIGHLKNAPPPQVPGLDPIDPSSKEMPVEEDDDDLCGGANEDLGIVVQQPSSSKDVMNGGELVQLEGDEDDDDNEEGDDDSDGDEIGDQTDEEEDEEGDSEDDYGYACY